MKTKTDFLKINWLLAKLKQYIFLFLQRREWKNFYKEKFNYNVNFSSVVIPSMPTDGKWRVLFIPKGMTLNFASEITKKMFKDSRPFCHDLDKNIKSIRNTEENYAIWVFVQCDFIDKSTHEVDPDMNIGITLLERIILEIKYFTETGSHLDWHVTNICSGSRYGISDVPTVDYYYRLKIFFIDACTIYNHSPWHGFRIVKK